MIQMYDMWVKASDKSKITGVCMLDMSAAFDVVDHEILLQKLELYGFDKHALSWIKDYLSGRSQSVYLDGCFSPFLALSAGVPQGSILGPLFYVLYTNDLPETIFEASHHNSQDGLKTHCDSCGSLVCFADDSTYCVSEVDLEVLERKLNEKYTILANYMADNKLKLNSDKTHLLIMATDQRRKHTNLDIIIKTESEDIKPINSEKLLGVKIQDNLKWKSHVLNLLKQLNTRLYAIRKIGVAASFKNRLMLANGILFMSKLIFQIVLWGGTEDYLLNALQVVQNKAARLVTKKDLSTPSSEVLLQCGWLNVRQLVAYHSIIQVYKTAQSGFPAYVSNRLDTDFPYNTRFSESESIRIGKDSCCKLEVTSKSFMYRGVKLYNQVPSEIKKVEKVDTFKVKLKEWLKSNSDLMV